MGYFFILIKWLRQSVKESRTDLSKPVTSRCLDALAEARGAGPGTWGKPALPVFMFCFGGRGV